MVSLFEKPFNQGKATNKQIKNNLFEYPYPTGFSGIVYARGLDMMFYSLKRL
jgi:hypothetical protein